VKKLPRSLTCLLLGFASELAAQDTEVFRGDWATLVQKASELKRFVLVDAYTEWCGPCKLMDKEVFHQNAEAASFYKDNYIVAKFDAEKDQGIEVAMKFHIRAYPTVLVLNSEMQLITKLVGYGGAKNFLDQCRNAMTLPAVPAVSGKTLALDVPDFYKQLYNKQGRPDSTAVNGWLAKQTDLFAESSWAVLSTFPLSPRYRDHCLGNIDRYAQRFGKADVELIASGYVIAMVRQAKATQNEKLVEEALALVDKAMSNPDDYRNWILQEYYLGTGNWKKAVAVMEDLRKSGKTNPAMLNQVAWTLYKSCDDVECLTMAGAWMKEVIAAEPAPAYLDTYAALLYKTGNYTDAETYARQAIAKAKEQGQDMTTSEELLASILKAKEGK
jgi:thiol-disulfide isomerase/thioredoxin